MRLQALFSDSERKMNSKYGRTLSFLLSKSLFFDEKCHFCSPASCGLLNTPFKGYKGYKSFNIKKTTPKQIDISLKISF